MNGATPVKSPEIFEKSAHFTYIIYHRTVILNLRRKNYVYR